MQSADADNTTSLRVAAWRNGRGHGLSTRIITAVVCIIHVARRDDMRVLTQQQEGPVLTTSPAAQFLKLTLDSCQLQSRISNEYRHYISVLGVIWRRCSRVIKPNSCSSALYGLCDCCALIIIIIIFSFTTRQIRLSRRCAVSRQCREKSCSWEGPLRCLFGERKSQTVRHSRTVDRKRTVSMARAGSYQYWH